MASFWQFERIGRPRFLVEWLFIKVARPIFVSDKEFQINFKFLPLPSCRNLNILLTLLKHYEGRYAYGGPVIGPIMKKFQIRGYSP
jgi:hypothetical protein